MKKAQVLRRKGSRSAQGLRRKSPPTEHEEPGALIQVLAVEDSPVTALPDPRDKPTTSTRFWERKPPPQPKTANEKFSLLDTDVPPFNEPPGESVGKQMLKRMTGVLLEPLGHTGNSAHLRRRHHHSSRPTVAADPHDQLTFTKLHRGRNRRRHHRTRLATSDELDENIQNNVMDKSPKLQRTLGPEVLSGLDQMMRRPRAGSLTVEYGGAAAGEDDEGIDDPFYEDPRALWGGEPLRSETCHDLGSLAAAMMGVRGYGAPGVHGEEEEDEGEEGADAEETKALAGHLPPPPAVPPKDSSTDSVPPSAFYTSHGAFRARINPLAQHPAVPHDPARPRGATLAQHHQYGQHHLPPRHHDPPPPSRPRTAPHRETYTVHHYRDFPLPPALSLDTYTRSHASAPPNTPANSPTRSGGPATPRNNPPPSPAALAALADGRRDEVVFLRSPLRWDGGVGGYALVDHGVGRSRVVGGGGKAEEGDGEDSGGAQGGEKEDAAVAQVQVQGGNAGCGEAGRGRQGEEEEDAARPSSPFSIASSLGGSDFEYGGPGDEPVICEAQVARVIVQPRGYIVDLGSGRGRARRGIRGRGIGRGRGGRGRGRGEVGEVQVLPVRGASLMNLRG